jgi:hypothetical protein
MTDPQKQEREELEKAVEKILALRTVDGRGYVPSEGLRALEHKRKVWQLVDFILADRAEHERKARIDEIERAERHFIYPPGYGVPVVDPVYLPGRKHRLLREFNQLNGDNKDE